MAFTEGGQGGFPLVAKQERIGRTPFEVSVITFNAGNLKRGEKLFREAVEGMVGSCSTSAGIIGFQEISTEAMPLLQQSLPSGWAVKAYPNPTDPMLSMAVAYDGKKLQLHGDKEITLPLLPEIHRRYDYPKREQPLERKAQFLHFTSLTDPATHVVLTNAHLSAKGFSRHRQEQMQFARNELDSFVSREGLHEGKDAFVTFLIGDLNTAGPVGTIRNRRQTRRMLQILGEEFVKLNNLLEPTSNVFSSILHKADDIIGTRAFDAAENILASPLRRGARVYAATEYIIERVGGQHRDHIFMRRGLHFEEARQTSAHILRSPGAIRASDHDAVVAHVHLLRTN